MDCKWAPPGDKFAALCDEEVIKYNEEINTIKNIVHIGLIFLFIAHGLFLFITLFWTGSGPLETLLIGVWIGLLAIYGTQYIPAYTPIYIPFTGNIYFYLVIFIILSISVFFVDDLFDMTILPIHGVRVAGNYFVIIGLILLFTFEALTNNTEVHDMDTLRLKNIYGEFMGPIELPVARRVGGLPVDMGHVHIRGISLGDIKL